MANMEVALITLHGMGETKEEYYLDLKNKVREALGEDWKKISFHSVYYQDLLQDNQMAFFNKVRARLDWLRIRKFMLYGFSDAGGLEYSRTIKDSIYEKVQERIFDVLGAAWKDLKEPQNKNKTVIFIAQSLGGQVLSNYIWDGSQATAPNYGIWRHTHSTIDKDDLKFRRLKNLEVLMTTGCNIPIFVAGLDPENIKPIDRPNDKFVWENYYDKDDVLGWPLEELSDGFKALVRDKQISVGSIFSGWAPFSHTKYWMDKDVIKPLVKHIKSKITQTE